MQPSSTSTYHNLVSTETIKKVAKCMVTTHIDMYLVCIASDKKQKQLPPCWLEWQACFLTYTLSRDLLNKNLYFKYFLSFFSVFHLFSHRLSLLRWRRLWIAKTKKFKFTINCFSAENFAQQFYALFYNKCKISLATMNNNKYWVQT